MTLGDAFILGVVTILYLVSAKGIQLLKTLGIPQVAVFLYANETAGGWGLLDSLRVRAGCKWVQP